MRYKNLVAFLNALVLVFFFVSLRPAPPVVTAQSSIGQEILSLGSEKCLEVASGSVTSGADVNQFRCYEVPHQKWVVHSVGAQGYVFFKNQKSNLCLDVRFSGPKKGTLQQFTCHQGDNQLFRLEPFRDGFDGVRIVSKHSGQCLDVPSGSKQDGVLIQQYPCNSQSNQRWIYAEGGPYSFQVSATRIGRLNISLVARGSYSFSLTNLPAGVVPSMRLWNSTHGSPRNWPISRVPTQSYVVPADQGGRYTLFLYAPRGVNAGTATLTIQQNNVVVYQFADVPFGGTVVDVPNSTSSSRFRYETAEVPGGVSDTVILALDNQGNLRAVDDDSGTGHTSRINGTTGISRVVVGLGSGNSGPVMLYANDIFRDLDDDGLGYGLERELRTCDMKGAQPHCLTVFNNQDTDRDGIEDGVEVLGVDVASNIQNGQTAPATSFPFPKWGANPRHKDIFIELDYVDEIGVNPFTHAYALAVQGLFSGALAAEIGNPDGQDGINVHLDIGLDPRPGFETLYGNWGNGGNHGPGGRARNNWQLQYPGHDNRREPWFFPVAEHGTAGTGDFMFNMSTWHEFSHTLFIGHESVRGGLNSSVVTPGLASYAQWRTPDARFLGNQFLDNGINSSSLCESSNEIGTALSDSSYRNYLQNNHGIWSDANTVDWNRDGVITNCTTVGRVKANLSAGPNDNCAPVQGEQIISKTAGTAGGSFGVGAGDVVGTIVGAPQMVRLGNAPNSFLYIFYAKTDPSYGTRLYYRAGRVSSDKTNGGCASSAGMEFLGNSWGPGTTTPCITWSDAALVSLGHALKRFAVTAFSDRIEIVASYSVNNYIAFHYLTGQNASTGLLGIGPVYVGGLLLSSSPRSDLQYEIVRAPILTGDPRNEHLAVFWIDTRTRELRWASKPAGTTGVPTLRGALWNDANPSIGLVAHDDSSLSLASWGSGMRGNLARETFLFFHDSGGTGNIYKLDPASEKWVNITNTALPGGNCAAVGQKIGFRFQEAVNSSGDILEAGKGHFYLTYKTYENLNCTERPVVATLNSGTVSGMPTALSTSRKPSAYLTHERSTRAVPNQGQVYGNTGIAYYSDSFVTSLKGVYVDAKGDLMFLPFADGILKMQYRPTNEFKILEATICRALKSHPITGLESWSHDPAAGDAFCGSNGMQVNMHPKDFVRSTQTLWGF